MSSSARSTPPFKDSLQEAKRVSSFPADARFLPTAALDRLVTTSVIESELRRANCPQTLSPLTTQRIQQTARKLFCFLCEIDAVEHLMALLEEGISDADLPFFYYESIRYPMLGSSSGNRLLASMAIFESHKVGSILRLQWAYLSPTFDMHGEHLTLPDNAILPIGKQIGDRIISNNSWLSAFEFEPSHFKALSPSVTSQVPSAHAPTKNPRDGAHVYVIKCLKRLQDFDKEREMLKACNDRLHTHIVPLLACFQWRDQLSLILPRATCNLQQLWMETVPIVGGRGYKEVVLALKQMLNLAYALNVIHTGLQRNGNPIFGLHGDVKATNILVFPAESADGPREILKLTDFSSSYLRSSADMWPTQPPGHVGTYQPPETLQGQPVSPKADIWSFGCVLLEFATWVEGGRKALVDFGLKREQKDYGYGFEFQNDLFYDLSCPVQMDASAPQRVTHVNTAVAKHFDRLRQQAVLPHTRSLVDLVEGHLLQVYPEDRATAQQTMFGLEEIISTVQDDSPKVQG